MNSGVNLLPWREQQRGRQRRGVAIIAIALWLGSAGSIGAVWWNLDRDIEHQRSRNQFLIGEISRVERQLQEVNEIQNRKEALIARMEVIRRLQADRVRLVRAMSELATTIPEGIFFSSLQRSVEGISLTGVAQSSSRISALMEQLADTASFDRPELNMINVGDTQEFELWVSFVRSNESYLTSDANQ
ncbi:PilN domain-containing protein [Gammaproteobacteria bacterium]|nr:PilN domain-containing protein [Gammaproteobacteria bacterium]MDG2237000.1 PilN domain-containing protein [Arenicellales bacterium]